MIPVALCRLKGNSALALCFMARTSLLIFLLTVPSLVFSQQVRVIRVGVSAMKNGAGRSVPGDLERDRLVKALNNEKSDKKLHLKIQAVALDGTNPEQVASQAAEKKCDYIVYTTLVELRTQGDSAEHRSGTIETNPNYKWKNQSAETAAMNPEYSATVEYSLYRTGDRSAMSSAPYSALEAMSDIEVVSQVMDMIANRVLAEVKKAEASHP